MSEGLGGVRESGFNDRPPHEAHLPMTETDQQNFTKGVRYWSGESEGAEASEAAVEQFVSEVARHRPMSGSARQRARSRSGMQYERDGLTVTCTSSDVYVSLRVEKREPEDDSELDKVTRIDYVIDGPDRTEVIEQSWQVDRESGKRIESEPTADIEGLFTFGEEHIGDITLPEGGDEVAFTRGRYWEAEDVLQQLDAGAWKRSIAEV